MYDRRAFLRTLHQAGFVNQSRTQYAYGAVTVDVPRRSIVSSPKMLQSLKRALRSVRIPDYQIKEA